MKRKVKNGIVSIVLSDILLCGFLLPTLQTGNFYERANKEETRMIDATKILNASEEDDMEEFLRRFDEYELIDEGGGQLLVREKNYLDDSTETYETRINYLENYEFPEFNITINTDYNNGQEDIEDYLTRLMYDSEEDEFIIEFNGEWLYVSELMEEGLLDNCVAIADDLAIAAAYLTISAIIICYPVIEKVVTTVVTMVTTFIRSIFSWIKKIFKVRRIETTIVTYETCYRFNIFERDFELEKVEVDNEPPRPEFLFYMAAVIGQYVYITREEITEEEAVHILRTNLEIIIQYNSNYSDRVQLNTYTFEKYDAERVAAIAGDGSAIPHTYHDTRKGQKKFGVYFQHFHPGYEYSSNSTHSFWGLPRVNI